MLSIISIHALLAESDQISRSGVKGSTISIHALLAESDRDLAEWIAFFPISIHALLAESDILPQHSADYNYHFYPRSPCGERRGRFFFILSPKSISIHALLAESDGCLKLLATLIPISIHALLAESDALDISFKREARISIHALLAESDPAGIADSAIQGDFYPRSPCGERQKCLCS